MFETDMTEFNHDIDKKSLAEKHIFGNISGYFKGPLIDLLRILHVGFFYPSKAALAYLKSLQHKFSISTRLRKLNQTLTKLI